MSESSADCSVVAFVSGKGGSGKTSVAIASAYLLSDLGFRVCLLDFDASTRGMTFFFLKHLTPGAAGWSESDTPARAVIRENQGEGCVHFIPIVGDIGTDLDPSGAGESFRPNVPDVLHGLADFHFVILDCQAGLSELTLLSGYKSNRINWLEIEGCGSLESMS